MCCNRRSLSEGVPGSQGNRQFQLLDPTLCHRRRWDLDFADAESTPAEAHPAAVEVTPELRSNIKSLTFASGYTCEEVTKAWWRYQDTERGNKLDYQCDGGKYLYAALMTPSGKVFISPR